MEYGNPYQRHRRSSRLWIGLLLAIIVIAQYLNSAEVNDITGEKQYIALSRDQEIALGLRAAPSMTAEYGGLDPSPMRQARVDRIGRALVAGSVAGKAGWKFDFHLLGDSQTINAFALPGGQVFLTAGLYNKLSTDGEIAAVLGHEIGHVLARHGAQHVAKAQLSQGLSQAAVVGTGDYRSGQLAQMVGGLLNLKYGRGDELESDTLGVRLMSEAGYDPRAMLSVMRILAAAGGDRQGVEFFSTHPNPQNRLGVIAQAIDRQFPAGVPAGLTP